MESTAAGHAGSLPVWAFLFMAVLMVASAFELRNAWRGRGLIMGAGTRATWPRDPIIFCILVATHIGLLLLGPPILLWALFTGRVGG